MPSLDDLDNQFFKNPQVQKASAGPKTLDDLDAKFTRDLKRSAATYPAPKKEVEPVGLDMFDKSTLQLGPLDTHIPIPASVARGLAQIGSGMADLPLAGRQLVGAANSSDVEAKRRIDEPLNKGVIGTINNLGGKAAPYAAMPYGGVSKIAGSTLGPILEGSLMSGLQGFLEPVGENDSRALNTGVAAGFGAVLPSSMALARKFASPDKALDPLIASAQARGIPLGIGDTSKNPFVKAYKSIGDDLGFGAGQSQEQIDAFNRAVGQTYGSQATKHTAGQRATDKKAITDVMNKVWSNNDLPYDANLFGSMRQLEAEAEKYPGDIKNTILAHIKDFESKVIQNPNGDLYIPGATAKEFQTDLFKNYGGKAGNGGALDNKMMEMRQNILDSFNANVHPDDKAALDLAREQYRAFKTVEPSLKKADQMVAGREVGDVRPSDLSASVAQNYDPAYPNPFGDLPQIGQTFLRDSVDRRGGSVRALLQNAGVGAGAAAGIGSLTGFVPAAVGSGALLGGYQFLKSPAIREALMNAEKQTPRLLSSPGEAAREGITNIVRQLPAAGALGALGYYRPTTSDETESASASPLEATDESRER